MQVVKNGHVITTLDQWKKFGAPKGKDKHWKDGRSAKECAIAWCGKNGAPTVPAEISTLLASHLDISNCVIQEVIPEHPVRFDKLPGEPRNSDICCTGRDDSGDLAISIEVKADESFGSIVSEELARLTKKIANDENTNGILRIQQLSRWLLPKWSEGLPHLGELRYQLLTGMAGAIAYAKANETDRAIFIIHEFKTSATTDEKHAANAQDLNRFMNRFSDGLHAELEEGWLYGPFEVAAEPSSKEMVKVYVGKVVRDLKILKVL